MGKRVKCKGCGKAMSLAEAYYSSAVRGYLCSSCRRKYAGTESSKGWRGHEWRKR